MFGAEQIIFRDDNFLVHPKRSRELLTKMLPLGLEWACQTDLGLSKRLDLAELAVDAGLRSICFGLESIHLANRKDMGKTFFNMNGVHDLLRLLSERGVETQVNMIFGLDHDTIDTFDEAVDFLLENGISTFYANILSPEPGTTLYKRLQEEKRIIDIHTLERECPENVNFIPKMLTAEQLVDRTRYARSRFHSERSKNLTFWLGPDKTDY
jgi:radical SAM superfamily enzyme YgiQ (UPF0313 family)